MKGWKPSSTTTTALSPDGSGSSGSLGVVSVVGSSGPGSVVGGAGAAVDPGDPVGWVCGSSSPPDDRITIRPTSAAAATTPMATYSGVLFCWPGGCAPGGMPP